MLSHVDPQFLEIMDDTRARLTRVLSVVNGYFGDRIAQIWQRYDGDVRPPRAPHRSGRHLCRKDLARRARNKRMKPEEFQGGTFTVSNLGGMGIDSFSAVINPPQGFILAVGRITTVPVVDNCDQIIVGHRMSLTMSCDHRVIDGALGAEYLKELRHLLENPAVLLV